MREDIPQIGMTYKILNRDGIYDLREIAKEYHAQQKNLENRHEWGYDRFLKNSSDARAEVFTPFTEESKLCSIWSINHYLGLNRHPYMIKKAEEALRKKSEPIIPVYARESQISKARGKWLFEKDIFTLTAQYSAAKTTERYFRFIINNSYAIINIDYLVKMPADLARKHGSINFGSELA